MPNNNKMFMSILTVLLIVVGAIMEDFYFSAKFRGLSEHEKKDPTHGNPTLTPQKSGEPRILYS